jgi:tRNA pseudouridine55 synthase
MSHKPPKNNHNGWLNLYKPLNVTSAKAVSIVKHNLRPQKIGHAGTLDPLASGVLPLALGEATKTMQFCMDTNKEYEFTVKWGEATATLDSEGEVIERSHIRPTKAQIIDILPQFTGEISQIPPAYSAIKINGKRAYDLARQGIEVEMKARKINIYELEMLDVNSQVPDKIITSPDTSNQQPEIHTTFRVLCGKGTYIRSLARDIAGALGTLAHVTVLTRTKVGNFSIKDAILLEDIGKTVYKNADSGALSPVDIVLDDIQVLDFTTEQAVRISQGQKIPTQESPNYNFLDGDIFIAKCEGKLIAICKDGDGLIKPIRVFNF